MPGWETGLALPQPPGRREVAEGCWNSLLASSPPVRLPAVGQPHTSPPPAHKPSQQAATGAVHVWPTLAIVPSGTLGRAAPGRAWDDRSGHTAALQGRHGVSSRDRWVCTEGPIPRGPRRGGMTPSSRGCSCSMVGYPSTRRTEAQLEPPRFHRLGEALRAPLGSLSPHFIQEIPSK